MSASWSQPPRPPWAEDPLAPARGIGLGIAIGLCLWLLVIGGLLWFTRAFGVFS